MRLLEEGRTAASMATGAKTAVNDVAVAPSGRLAAARATSCMSTLSTRKGGRRRWAVVAIVAVVGLIRRS